MTSERNGLDPVHPVTQCRVLLSCKAPPSVCPPERERGRQSVLGCARGESGASQTRCDGQRRAHPAPSLRRGRTRPGRAASLTPVASLSFLNFLSVIQWLIQRRIVLFRRSVDKKFCGEG